MAMRLIELKFLTLNFIILPFFKHFNQCANFKRWIGVQVFTLCVNAYNSLSFDCKFALVVCVATSNILLKSCGLALARLAINLRCFIARLNICKSLPFKLICTRLMLMCFSLIKRFNSLLTYFARTGFLLPFEVVLNSIRTRPFVFADFTLLKNFFKAEHTL